MIGEKTLRRRIFTSNLRDTYLYENNFNYISYKISYKLAFITLFSFNKNQNYESNLQQLRVV